MVPGCSYLTEQPERVIGVVLTHAHEDHMGALPYFLRDFDVPVYGTRLSLGMLSAKLEEYNLKPSLVEVRPGERVSLGPFDLEFFAVSHSIPDGMAVALRMRAGTIVHTGDFKLDLTPIDSGRPISAGSRGWLVRASTCCCRIRPTLTRPATSPPRSRSVGPSARFSRPPSIAWWWPASPATCTACSRSSTTPTSSAARSPW